MRLIVRFVDLFTFRGNRARETNDYKSNFLSLVLTNKNIYIHTIIDIYFIDKIKVPNCNKKTVNKKRSHQRDHITTHHKLLLIYLNSLINLSSIVKSLYI